MGYKKWLKRIALFTKSLKVKFLEKEILSMQNVSDMMLKCQGLQDAALRTSEEQPPIRDDRHFADNKEMVEIIQPIDDLIGEFEKSKTNIANIVVKYIKLHK
jgi:hypothetical protein